MLAKVAFLEKPFSLTLDEQGELTPEFRTASYLIRAVVTCGATFPKIEQLDVHVHLGQTNVGKGALDGPLRLKPPDEEVASPYSRRDELALSLKCDGQELTHEFEAIHFAGSVGDEDTEGRGVLLRYEYRQLEGGAPDWLVPGLDVPRIKLHYPADVAPVVATANYSRPLHRYELGPAAALTGADLKVHVGERPLLGCRTISRPSDGADTVTERQFLSYRNPAGAWLPFLLYYDPHGHNPAMAGATPAPEVILHDPAGNATTIPLRKNTAGRLLYAESNGVFSRLRSTFGADNDLAEIDFDRLGGPVESGSPAALVARDDRRINIADVVLEKVVLFL